MLIDLITHAFVTFVVVIDPIGLAPVFAGMTAAHGDAERRRIVLLGVAVAAVVLIMFALIGGGLVGTATLLDVEAA